ncbi:MAG: hydantoinase B/oxoprolinase family protein [Anaerolineae bacterium]
MSNALAHKQPEIEHELDLAQYEIFAHRLFNILEEGRIAMRHVSGSPVVVEGGETMCAFYTPGGEAFLTGAGILIHVTGASQFVRRTMELYSQTPGIHDGDQFLWNDPYTGGLHTLDHIIIKPIFHEGQLVAWVGSFMHTPEVGAIDPTGTCPRATEIYHEGMRAFGLKIVERGQFRQEIFNTVTWNTRDPDLVGLDHKAKIAANNVCARLFIELLERFGRPFVSAASQRLIEDADRMARARLVRLPDGVWRSQLFGDSDGMQQKPFRVFCTMTKKGDTLTFDYSGTSAQNPGSLNAALPATQGRIFAVLLYHLFWGLPWNAGVVKAVNLITPAGTVVNCNYPAPVSNAASGMGGLLGEPAHECIAKMLYAAGPEFWPDALSSFSGSSQHAYWAGLNQFGKPFVGTVLDHFAGGYGATPSRDGVDTGGKMITPAASIIDVEIFEATYPMIYLFRQHARDTGGPGRWRGGLGGESAHMFYGTHELEMGAYGCGTQTSVLFGLFGGYPGPPSRTAVALQTDLQERLARGEIPGNWSELAQAAGQAYDLRSNHPAFPVQEYDVVYNRWLGGSGYGDPLERDPQLVVQDVLLGAVSRETAGRVFGVQLVNLRPQVDLLATEVLRARLRSGREEQGRYLFLPEDVKPPHSTETDSATARRWRFHEYLEIVETSGGALEVCCRLCETWLGPAADNYKRYSLVRRRQPDDYLPLRHPAGDFNEYWEYYCPGCLTQLAVDVMDPTDQEPIWDTQLDLSWFDALATR